jgi:hypothetical protein
MPRYELIRASGPWAAARRNLPWLRRPCLPDVRWAPDRWRCASKVLMAPYNRQDDRFDCNSVEKQSFLRADPATLS